MDDLYRENILEHYKRPHNWSPPAEELERVDFQFHDLNPLCGDELTVKLAVDGDERVTITAELVPDTDPKYVPHHWG